MSRADRRELTFERDVRPILKTHCFQCHGEGEKLKGGVDLRLRRFMVKAAEDGAPCIVPGKPDESEMFKLVREGEMPQKGKKLSAKEIAMLERWIAQGAKTARPEPEQVPKFWITEEERAFWAFQPLQAAGGAEGESASARPHSDRRLPPREARSQGARLHPRPTRPRCSAA